MRVIGLAGWSGAGKTTLLVRLLPELLRRGISVSTVKRAHHDFDVDEPGKDSFRHREAGASEVMIASGRRVALMQELRGAPEPGLLALLDRLSPVDLVLVEGFKGERHPKIEVHRAATSRPLLYGTRPGIAGIASDIALAVDVPVVELDDIPAIACLALAHAIPLDELRRLSAAS